MTPLAELTYFVAVLYSAEYHGNENGHFQEWHTDSDAACHLDVNGCGVEDLREITVSLTLGTNYFCVKRWVQLWL
eukprot:SAG31_NODE_8954_length_1357_cov_2.085056_1_plen_75_part_00